jgi:Protein of unknown function (DUF2934)
MARTSNREEIERRAYEIYEQRGRENGHELEHWLEAEQEVSRRASPESERRSSVTASRSSYTSHRA